MTPDTKPTPLSPAAHRRRVLLDTLREWLRGEERPSGVELETHASDRSPLVLVKGDGMFSGFMWWIGNAPDNAFVMLMSRGRTDAPDRELVLTDDPAEVAEVYAEAVAFAGRGAK